MDNKLKLSIKKLILSIIEYSIIHSISAVNNIDKKLKLLIINDENIIININKNISKSEKKIIFN